MLLLSRQTPGARAAVIDQDPFIGKIATRVCLMRNLNIGFEELERMERDKPLWRDVFALYLDIEQVEDEKRLKRELKRLKKGKRR